MTAQPRTPIHNAFVLGAGLGTRLLSLTARRPKPLIPVCNKPLITFAFDHLLRLGVSKLVVNTHHCHEEYARTFPENRYGDAPLHFTHEPDLLETAGGIKNAQPLLNGEPFIVYNGDVLTDLPITPAIDHHLGAGNEVTLVLRSKDGPLHVSLDEETHRVVDIAHRLRHRIIPKYLFTGVYIVNPEFFRRIPLRTKISVIPIFMEMIRDGAKLGGIVLDDGHWWDLGTRDKYLDIHRHFHDLPQNGLVWIHPDAEIDPTAQVLGATAIGPRSKIGPGASLNNCIVWNDAEIAPDSVLHDCIVTAGMRAGGVHTHLDF